MWGGEIVIQFNQFHDACWSVAEGDNNNTIWRMWHSIVKQVLDDVNAIDCCCCYYCLCKQVNYVHISIYVLTIHVYTKLTSLRGIADGIHICCNTLYSIETYSNRFCFLPLFPPPPSCSNTPCIWPLIQIKPIQMLKLCCLPEFYNYI